jgi:hypothetical protein
MPTRWSGSNIIVADAVTIAPPYRVDDCRPLVENDTAALARVRKVVSVLTPDSDSETIVPDSSSEEDSDLEDSFLHEMLLFDNADFLFQA